MCNPLLSSDRGSRERGCRNIEDAKAGLRVMQPGWYHHGREKMKVAAEDVGSGGLLLPAALRDRRAASACRGADAVAAIDRKADAGDIGCGGAGQKQGRADKIDRAAPVLQRGVPGDGVVIGRLRPERFGHVGLVVAGSYRVDADALRSECVRKRTRQAEQPGLAGAI